MIVTVGREVRKIQTSTTRTGSSGEWKGITSPESGGEIPGRDWVAQTTGTLFLITCIN